MKNAWYTPTFVLLALTLLLAACGGSTATAPEVVATEVVDDNTTAADATEAPAADATEAPAADATEAPAADATETASGSFTEPHPTLSVREVRQAIAHCTDRPELLEAVYPYLEADERDQLLMDTFLPQGHWALNTDVPTYPLDPATAQELLEAAGWTLADGAEIRTNADGDELELEFLTTDAQFRQTWAAVFEQQMLNNCGIRIIRTHAPAALVFGDESGLQRREFELGGFAWVGQADPGGTTLYTCDQIPLPENGWEGQNYMGWCNETASRAIIAANSTLDREERITQYGIVQEEFAADMVSLPLFNRIAIAAATNNLLNYRPDSTEYHTANVSEWELADGGDTLIIGTTAEPETLYTVVDSFAGTQAISFLLSEPAVTSYNYDYQPVGLTELPTLENGGATLEEVEVSEGDLIWNADGEIIPLEPGVEIVTADGETITYEEGTVTMNQLAVTFEYVAGLTWSDGEPVKQADYELGVQIACDPESGAISLRLCESRENIEFLSDTSYTITYVPGTLWPLYFAFTSGYVAPSHQVLADGRNLADVPASEWPTLTEISETPLGYGPYRIVSWEKGQRMTFEVNPFYYKGEPAIKTIIVEFLPDTNQAVAQLLSGTVDVVGNLDLDGGPEVEPIIAAGESGDLQVFQVASPTWEHIDMNQNIP